MGHKDWETLWPRPLDILVESRQHPFCAYSEKMTIPRIAPFAKANC